MADRAEQRLRIQFERDTGRVAEEHRESIRVFLAQIDPNTGYIEDE
jgi:hypothetical protein